MKMKTSFFFFLSILPITTFISWTIGTSIAASLPAAPQGITASLGVDKAMATPVVMMTSSTCTRRVIGDKTISECVQTTRYERAASNSPASEDASSASDTSDTSDTSGISGISGISGSTLKSSSGTRFKGNN